MAVRILKENNRTLKSAVTTAKKALKSENGDYFQLILNRLASSYYDISKEQAKSIEKIMNKYEDPDKDNSEGIKQLNSMITKKEANSVSASDMFNAIPEQGLRELVKSAGVDLNGNESEDELRGMLKVIPKTEAMKKRINRLAKICECYESDNDFGVYPVIPFESEECLEESVFDGGSFNVQAIIRNINELDANDICEEVEKLIKSKYPQSTVYSVQYNNVSENMFENNKEETYVYHHDTMDSDLVPDIDEKCNKDNKDNNDDKDDKEVLTEKPPKECKKYKSKFIK